MIYALRHLTTYRYARTVRFARCNLRLTPREGDGQRVLASDIAVAPAPKTRLMRRAYFGPETVTVTIDQPHRIFAVEAVSRVEVARAAPPDPDSGPSWETLRERALALPAIGPDDPSHFMFASPRTPLLPAITDYARASFPPGRSALGGACELMARIRDEFRFDNAATTVTTPIAKAFAQRAGVCQDFTQIMISALRGLGLPAAYVSGYLRTEPPPGRPRLRGADASHAWVSFWCDAETGWVGLDPTNGICVRDDHIELTRGRDYGDVAPIDGIVAAPGGQRLKVEVDVVPEGEPMPAVPGDGLSAP